MCLLFPRHVLFIGPATTTTTTKKSPMFGKNIQDLAFLPTDAIKFVGVCLLRVTILPTVASFYPWNAHIDSYKMFRAMYIGVHIYIYICLCQNWELQCSQKMLKKRFRVCNSWLLASWYCSAHPDLRSFCVVCSSLHHCTLQVYVMWYWKLVSGHVYGVRIDESPPISQCHPESHTFILKHNDNISTLLLIRTGH